MASILLVVKHALEERRAAERMARIERDTATSDGSAEAGSQKSAPGATAPGDARRLRGIPAIGRGVAGAITGTRPEDAIEAVDYQRRATPSDD